MRVLAVVSLVACASSPRPVPPPPVVGLSPAPVTPPAAPAGPVSPWPVPMRVMVWTADGVQQIGELPKAPPAAAPTAPWFVEPVDVIDEATFQRIVVAMRLEHVPGLSLRDQPAAAWLDELREVPDLTALVLDDTTVDGAALQTLDLPLKRLYLARTQADDAAVAALAARPALASLELLDLEDCPITDKGAKALVAFKELHAINLSGTRITDAGGAALGALTRLSIVDLGSTRVGIRTVAALRPLALTELFLDDTLAGAEIATLAGFAPGISRFDVSSLQSYKPTDADVAWLAQAPRLIEVGLSGSKVHDRLVQSLLAAPGLRRLRLAGTPITLPTIQAIAKRSQLEQVDLAETPVDDASAAALIAMPQMRVLRRDRTQIGDTALRATPSPALAELYVSKTKVTDAGLAILDKLPNLEALGIGETNAGDPTVARVVRLAKLHTLVLSQATASAGGLAQLGVLRELERLYLENTGADDTTLVGLAPLRELRVLHLANTQVSDEALPMLRAFRQLDELTVGDTRMHSGIADLSAWPHLRTLSLQGLDLTDAALATIALRTSLVTLDLSATEIHDPSPLAQLPHLRTLGLVGTRLTPAGTASAKKLEAKGVEVVQ